MNHLQLFTFGRVIVDDSILRSSHWTYFQITMMSYCAFIICCKLCHSRYKWLNQTGGTAPVKPWGKCARTASNVNATRKNRHKPLLKYFYIALLSMWNWSKKTISCLPNFAVCVRLSCLIWVEECHFPGAFRGEKTNFNQYNVLVAYGESECACRRTHQSLLITSGCLMECMRLC